MREVKKEVLDIFMFYCYGALLRVFGDGGTAELNKNNYRGAIFDYAC